jgi:hypothetical protein
MSPKCSDKTITALARASSSCKRQILPLVRKDVPHQEQKMEEGEGAIKGRLKESSKYVSFVIDISHQILLSVSMARSAHSGLRPLIQFLNHFSQTVGLLGRVISPSQGRYLNTDDTDTE